MPIYEFVCRECGHEFEQIQSFSESSMPGCPVCGEENVTRQVGRPAIHFKGSGWYITDSKNAAKSSANGTKNDDADSKATKADEGTKKSDGDSSTKADSSKAESTAPAKTSDSKSE